MVMEPRVPRIAVFLSGSGRTLVNLHEAIERGRLGAGQPDGGGGSGGGGLKVGGLHAEISLVVASKECLGAERARGLGIPTQVRRGALTEVELTGMLAEHRIDWVVLAGYLRLMPIPTALAGRVVNIHPALLPAFGGEGMYGHHVHEAVIAAGCKVSGCTVHLCDSAYDRGPIVMQRTCDVRDDDTPDTLAARVFEQECIAYPAALELLLSGRVEIVGRRTRIVLGLPH